MQERNKIHFQHKFNEILCVGDVNKIKRFSNDIGIVTCKICLYLYNKNLREETKIKDNKRLKEILNKKELDTNELDKSLNCMESGYIGY